MLKSLSFAAVSVLALALSACSQPASPDAAPKATNGVLNLYTARHYDADEKIYAAFTKATGIEVRRLEMKPDQLIEKMKAEADASPADVILMADAGALWRAENAGLLQPVTSETLTAKIPEAQRDPSGLWFGFSKRARVIVYDTNKVKPEEVVTYESLASPRFKGKVCVRSSDNVYNLSIMAAMIEHWGPAKAEQWARGVVANMARPPEGGDTDQIRAVAAGVCEVALSNTYYYLRLADSKDAKDVDVVAKTKLAFPAFEGKGTHVNISGGGVAKHAPNKEAAIKFLEFMTTPEAQKIFAEANYEYPVLAGVETPAVVSAANTFTADPVSVRVYGTRQAEAQSLLSKAGWR